MQSWSTRNGTPSWRPKALFSWSPARAPGKTAYSPTASSISLKTAGAKPNEILAITFTNKAAGEMKRRLEGMVGGVARTMWVMTFHAACGRILRREAPRLGYKSNFTIYDQADQVRVVKQCLEELDRDPKRFVPRHPRADLERQEHARRRGGYRARVASFYDQTVADVYDLYQRRLFASNALDFDSMVMLTVVLERFPEARKRWQKAFRYVLVDEYRTRTTHSTASFNSWPAAQERVRSRRSRPVDPRSAAPTSGTSSSSRRTSVRSR